MASITVFDVVNFYPSFRPELLKRPLGWAWSVTDISEFQRKVIENNKFTRCIIVVQHGGKPMLQMGSKSQWEAGMGQRPVR